MGKLHNLLERSGYRGHALEVLLVRLLELYQDMALTLAERRRLGRQPRPRLIDTHHA